MASNSTNSDWPVCVEQQKQWGILFCHILILRIPIECWKKKNTRKRNEDNVMDGSQMFEFLDGRWYSTCMARQKRTATPPEEKRKPGEIRSHIQHRVAFRFASVFDLYSERRVHDSLRRRINHGVNFHCVTFLVTRVIEAKPICT